MVRGAGERISHGDCERGPGGTRSTEREEVGGTSCSCKNMSRSRELSFDGRLQDYEVGMSDGVRNDQGLGAGERWEI